jgi:hypothetical protein
VYTIKVYVNHGYFEYEVNGMAQAMDHAEVIMQSRVYRRSVGDNAVEFLPVYKVKVTGDGLSSEYHDKFRRT